ncbi:MAG: hypothetical protein IJ064_03270 [Bacteroidaceae bacterium]|nr:hypothetical protein [Bacteroidaceae bacterium]
MMKKIQTYLMLPLAVGLAVSCSQSEDLTVPAQEVYETPPVRILPSAGGQDFDVSIETRSTGPFERWSLDQAHWQAADFYTFALQTRNTIGGVEAGELNFRTSDVMWNQLMRIQDAQGNVRFYDNDAPTQEVFRYYSNWRARRYKFFTYHADDAVLSLNPSTDKITASLTINGHQDIMHGFAYHTDNELQALIDNMPDGENKTNFTTTPESRGGREYLYSGMSGNRGIHPRFHLHHLLSRFDVQVQGMKGANEKYSFLQVLVDSVVIKAPARGTLTIADDQWTDSITYNQAVEAQNILTWGTDSTDYQLELIPHTTLTDGGCLPGVDYSILQDSLQDLGIITSGMVYHQICDTLPTPLCQAALLPAAEEGVSIHVYYRYIFAHWDGATRTWTVDAKSTNAATNQWQNSTRLMPRDTSGQPVRFKAGGQYTVLIKIYGPEEITATVAGLDEEQWTDENSDNPFDIHD